MDVDSTEVLLRWWRAAMTVPSLWEVGPPLSPPPLPPDVQLVEAQVRHAPL